MGWGRARVCSPPGLAGCGRSWREPTNPGLWRRRPDGGGRLPALAEGAAQTPGSLGRASILPTHRGRTPKGSGLLLMEAGTRVLSWVMGGHTPPPPRSLAQKRSGTDPWPSPKTQASVSTSVQRGASDSAAWAGPGSEHVDLVDFGSCPLHPTMLTSLPDH